MNFGQAINLAEQGERVMRSGWNRKGMYVFLIGSWTYTDGRQDNYPNLPFFAMKTADDRVVPWFPSQTDILAEDWSWSKGTP